MTMIDSSWIRCSERMPTAEEMLDCPAPVLWVNLDGITLLPWSAPPPFPILWSKIPAPPPMDPLHEPFETYARSVGFSNFSKREYSGLYASPETNIAWVAFQAGYKHAAPAAIPTPEPSPGSARGPLTLASFQRDVSMLFNTALHGCGSNRCIVKPMPQRGNDIPCVCTPAHFRNALMLIFHRLTGLDDFPQTEKPHREKSLQGNGAGRQ